MKNKERPFLILIKLWKWFHILAIIANVIILLRSFICRDYIVRKIWELSSQTPIFSSSTMVVMQIFGLILSILIVYGIIKIKKMGFYVSLIDITYIDIIYLMYLRKATSAYIFIVYLIGILIYTSIGYIFYKERKFFHID